MPMPGAIPEDDDQEDWWKFGKPSADDEEAPSLSGLSLSDNGIDRVVTSQSEGLHRVIIGVDFGTTYTGIVQLTSFPVDP
jgi:hypothetical protein